MNAKLDRKISHVQPKCMYINLNIYREFSWSFSKLFCLRGFVFWGFLEISVVFNKWQRLCKKRRKIRFSLELWIRLEIFRIVIHLIYVQNVVTDVYDYEQIVEFQDFISHRLLGVKELSCVSKILRNNFLKFMNFLKNNIIFMAESCSFYGYTN